MSTHRSAMHVVPSALRASALLAACIAGCAVEPDPLTVHRFVVERDGAPSVAAELPAHLQLPWHELDYALVADVELPAELRDRTLELHVARFSGRLALEVDGAPATRLGWSPPARHRSEAPHVFAIPREASRDGALHVVLRARHAWTQSAWWDHAPQIVAAGAPVRATTLAFVDVVVLGATALVGLFQVGLACLLVYLVDRSRRAYMWFAIGVLSAAAYPAHELGLTQWVFGSFDAIVVCEGLLLAPVAGVYFTVEMFGLAPVPRWVGRLTLMLVPVPLIALGPWLATPYAAPLAVASIVVTCTYQIATTLALARTHRDRPSALLLLSAWVALSLLAIPDLAAWLGLGASLGATRGACAGLTLFALLLTALFSRVHIVTLRHETLLRAALDEARKRDVATLEGELKREVASRSAQLYAALALVGRRRSARPFAVGDVVSRRYRVIRALGTGGMGTVYEVERIRDGRRFALKIAREPDPAALARLAREALVASQVSHPCLVGLVDVDVATEGHLFFVMELAQGETLLALARTEHDDAWKLAVLASVAEGLAALHESGIVHRDLKPANVIVDETTGARPRTKIADFGIARWAAAEVVDAGSDPPPPPRRELEDDATETRVEAAPPGAAPDDLGALTRADQIAGTPLYLPPEASIGTSAMTLASDVFALGIVAFELLAGQRPFERSVALDLARGRSIAAPPSLGVAWGGDIRVIALVDACLAFDPPERPTAGRVRDVLVEVLADMGEAPSQHVGSSAAVGTDPRSSNTR